MLVSVFESPKNIRTFFLCITFFLILSVYSILQISFNKSSSALVELWMQNEKISLQQGNFLTSVTKLQRSIEDQTLISGVSVLDKSNGKTLISFGTVSKVNTISTTSELNILYKKYYLFNNIYTLYQSNVIINIFTKSNALIYILILIVIYFLLILVASSYAIKTYITQQQEIKNALKINQIQTQLLANQELSLIAAQLAHDIRSPLTAVKNVILTNNHLSLIEKEVLELASSRITELTKDILKKSKTLLGSATENKNSFDIIPALKAIVKEKDFLIQPLSININLSKANSKILVCGNLSDFQRIVSNLLDNAVESLQEAKTPTISLALTEYSETALITISDNGHGIHADQLAQLGQPGVSFKKKNGSGFGIYFSQKKIREWGGSINITSNYNEGTIVSFSLKKMLKQN